MNRYCSQVTTIIWKDFITEIKTRELFSSMFIFALLVVIIFICRNNWTQSIVHAREGKRLLAGVASSAHGQDGTLFWKPGQQLRVFVHYGGIYSTTFHGFF